MKRWLLLFCLLTPQWAHAHLVSTRFGEYYAGLLHPVITLSHLIPWLALALVAGLQNTASARTALPLFPLAVLAGAALGSTLPAQQWIAVINLISFLVLGGLVLAARPLPPRFFIALVMATGLSHGYANGMPELFGQGLVLYLAGVTCAAYLLVSILTAASHQLITQRSWGIIAVRAGGSWIAAIGFLYLAFTLFVTGAAGS
ncbi:MAG: hypothetical protein CMK83_20050 [Pseudomonadales bacterium]|jgi:urease accessory protein|uniref:HupE/UreJ family protein n=1 Tax=unclassified Ketobacter TaxID=2639109 RepID=UPI000C3F01CA|nr:MULTISPECIES: HupE/UreJ family protein [unclassified Ketobacter]MAA60137.1 hypothetical protein [Pseudomonadales bacterium]MEC8812237.1 HupE/UreJ family protein [Pseudomonadota bacterium]TNC89648.1 MAG: hypothetical protein CSH49_06390 [Alcanivorax sp.]HAG94897.1 hypothetical protein [Gammaproteobacteria bacterium]MAQ26508.1 hypothetical protein [Pseudomonadales bacterium]|tara:strand:+ start:10909 stop:11514 length:606 start_codon:yes stop_codon:yes gene_type:complete